MNKKLSILVGLTLILLGAAACAHNLAAPILGLDVRWHWWGVWRLWPLVVVSVGLLLALSPLMVRRHRSLGILFILGVPILTTGGILLFTNSFDAWSAWEWLWPLEVLALATGFLFAAIHMQSAWLLMPAIVIGANGVLFQFCAVTGLWRVWAVLWTVEPLSVGLSLLVIGAARRSRGLSVAGLTLCGLAGMGLTSMTSLMRTGWLINLLGPMLLILVGFLVLVATGCSEAPKAER